ncbi:MAG: hypothetical protein HKN29_15805 [Rhodothermales bacterium]|nr:hypothetical protein [Rhodothermales bacterium]
MFVSDITVSRKCDRAAMYTILVNLKSEEDAINLAERLAEEIQPEGVRTELFVWRPSDSPTVVDAYTFEKRTAEEAHAFLTEMAGGATARAA